MDHRRLVGHPDGVQFAVTASHVESAVVNHQRTPVEETSAYSFRGKSVNASELSHLVFMGDAPPLKFAQAGSFFGETGGGVVLEIPNASDQPLNLNVSLELLRRKPDAKGNYLPNVTAGVT